MPYSRETKHNNNKMKKPTKYTYWKVIQQCYAGQYGYEDVSHYEANSDGTAKDRKLLQHDLKEYKLLGYPTRVIFRREIKAIENLTPQQALERFTL